MFNLDIYTMIEFVCWIAIVALLAAWIITLADKWGIREWLQVHADAIVNKILPWYDSDFFNRLFSCNFCCSFHLSMIISIFIAIFVTWWYICIPLFSTIITTKLLSR